MGRKLQATEWHQWGGRYGAKGLGILQIVTHIGLVAWKMKVMDWTGSEGTFGSYFFRSNEIAVKGVGGLLKLEIQTYLDSGSLQWW